MLFQDSIRTMTAFNLPDDAYAATVAEQSAREEAADALGREIADARRRLHAPSEREGT